MIVTVVSLISLVGVTAVASPPVFGQGSYFMQGVVSLPYADINEPVSVWVDHTATSGVRQRIDYYDGQDSLFFLPSSGESFEVVPTGAKTTCFRTSQNATVSIDRFFPDLADNYTLVASAVVIRGIECDQYRSVVDRLDRTNTYDFFVTADAQARPVRFKFIGYDQLLGSHYDLYVFDYLRYEDGLIDTGVFNKLDAFRATCLDLGQGVGPSVAELFPFRSEDHSRVHARFDTFKSEFGKTYDADTDEHRQRLSAFQNNLRVIASTNRRQSDFRLAVNHLADLLPAELHRLHPSRGMHVARVPTPLADRAVASTGLPTELDWRPKGAVSAVKDQGICGSCWSFGAAETVEGSLFLKTGKLTRLSSQALVDCSWSFGNSGCDGGLDFLGYEWALKAGYLPTEASYPYRMADGYCHYEEAMPGAVLRGYVNVTAFDVTALKRALVVQGPISISINASPKTFGFYSSGVYSDPACTGGVMDLDHTVLAVGWGVDAVSKQEYWIVKNSWSTYWGDQGYIKIAIQGNVCGVTTTPTYAIL